jgi:hypothetical protein
MAAFFLSLFRFLRLLMSGHQAIAIENATLRIQLAAFRCKHRRPVLTRPRSVFWIALRRIWSGWRGLLTYVQPDTVVRWQRERFRRFWARLSQPHGDRHGRPAIALETRRVIKRRGFLANHMWPTRTNARPITYSSGSGQMAELKLARNGFWEIGPAWSQTVKECLYCCEPKCCGTRSSFA